MYLRAKEEVDEKPSSPSPWGGGKGVGHKQESERVSACGG